MLAIAACANKIKGVYLAAAPHLELHHNHSNKMIAVDAATHSTGCPCCKIRHTASSSAGPTVHLHHAPAQCRAMFAMVHKTGVPSTIRLQKLTQQKHKAYASCSWKLVYHTHGVRECLWPQALCKARGGDGHTCVQEGHSCRVGIMQNPSQHLNAMRAAISYGCQSKIRC